MASSYRLGRLLKSGYRGVLDYVTYLQSLPKKIADDDSGGDGDTVSFILTAGQISVVTGYNPAFSAGEISAEPIDGHTLALFYSRSDDHTTVMQFDGDVTALLAGKTIKINGVPKPADTDWTYDGSPGIDASAAGWNSELFTAATDYVISW